MKKILSLAMAVALAVTLLASVSAIAEEKPFEGVTITF